MKWRHSIIYLSILLVLGGYFYYFEIIRKDQKAAAEKEAKRVFTVGKDKIRALEISTDNETVRLKNEGQWQIVEPIQSDVDEGSLLGLLDTLGALSAQKQIAASPADVKAYGLEKPPLKIRFQAGGSWTELLLGDKNPIGDGYYAKTNGKKNVFLIEAGDWSTLSKGLNDLRRRELFTFQQEEVTGIHIAWDDNSTVHVEQTEDEEIWKALDKPEVSIRKGKVENVLTQLHWLRATKFLENEVQNLGVHGLESPHVTVTLRLKKEREVMLRLGKKASEQDEGITAVSSELPAVVQIAADVLGQLPKSLKDLEDRSFFAFDPKTVKEVRWKKENSQGQVVEIGNNKWGWKTGDEAPKEIEESWRVGGLLWELQDAEYEQKINPAPPVPAQPYIRLELRDGEKMLEALSWEKSAEESSPKVTVWIETADRTQAVEIKGETVLKIENKLNEIPSGESVNR